MSDVLDQITDSSVQAAKYELKALLSEAKADSDSFYSENARLLEERLEMVRDGRLEKDDFLDFIEVQKGSAEVFVRSQAVDGQARAERLTVHVLEIAATKILPILLV